MTKQSAEDDHYLKLELYQLVRDDPAIFDFLQAGSLDGIWYWDLENPEHEWMSPRFWELLGDTPGTKQHLAREWQDRIHPGDLARCKANLERHCEDTNHPYDQIVRYTHRDSSTVWVRCRGIVIRAPDGTPIRMLGAHTDVTSLERAQRQIRSGADALNRQLDHARIRAEAIVNSSDDSILTKSLDGIIHSWNPAAERMYGYSASEMIGNHINIIIPPAKQDEHATIMRNLVSGSKVERLHTERVRRDGVCFYVSLSVSPLIMEGETVGAVAIARDITDVLETQLALEQQTRLLKSANQELEGFSYSVSHDLRAPLRAISGFSRILVTEHSAQLDDEGERILSIIQRNIDEMELLIGELLRFSQIGRADLKRDTIDMRRLALGVWEQLTSVDCGGDVEFHMDQLPKAEGDATLLKQVWVNLLDNALKYSSTRAARRITVSGTMTDKELCYSISDNGVGFDMRYADKLFGVFQRLHGRVEFNGSGVGLAIVHRIITRHGGRVSAAGEVGRGACFTFCLPAPNFKPEQVEA